MAYHSYNYNYSYCDGEYSVTPYYSGYDSACRPDPVTYSSYKYNDLNNYFAAYDSAPSFSARACDASAFSEPLRIEYDPGPFEYTQTRISVFYSTSEFNEPEFEEYDSTPYGGGYDITLTYGKSLPPSDEICYPRSSPDSSALALDGGSELTKEPPRKEEADEQAAKLPGESKLLPIPVQDEDQQPWGQVNGHDNSGNKALELYQGEESSESDHSDSWSGYETAYGNGNQEYDSCNSASQIPSGYGLEAVDLCEGLFGYWPCLSRHGQRGNGFPEVTDHGSNGNQWKATADYLFGSMNPYD